MRVFPDSGSTTSVQIQPRIMSYTMESVLALSQEKDALEQTLKGFWDVLNSNNVGLSESLVDSEGYPRSDIDIYQVRHARHMIKCLQNDHTALLRRIEEGLVAVHSLARDSANDPNGVLAPEIGLVHEEPFAKVDHIDLGSPANLGSIQVNDLLLRFGSVTLENFRSLACVGQLVQNSVNKQVQVVVKRNGKPVTVYVTPRPWAGRGLLGCNIVPLDHPDR